MVGCSRNYNECVNNSVCGKMCQCSLYDSVDNGTTHKEKTLMTDNTFVSPICAYRTYGSFHNSLLSLTAIPKPLTYPFITEMSLIPTIAPLLTEQEHDKLLKGLGSLYKFPRELRDMIYEHMIAQGSLAIMRTSPTLQKEVSERDIYKHGFCRLNMNFYDAATFKLKPCFNPSPSLVAKIQNLAIRVDTRFNASSYYYTTKEIDILSKFIGTKVRRKTCVVSFVRMDKTRVPYHEDVLDEVQFYTGFEKVEVAMEWATVEKRPNDRWADHITKVSVQQIYEYDSKKQANLEIWSVLRPKLRREKEERRHKEPKQPSKALTAPQRFAGIFARNLPK